MSTLRFRIDVSFSLIQLVTPVSDLLTASSMSPILFKELPRGQAFYSINTIHLLEFSASANPDAETKLRPSSTQEGEKSCDRAAILYRTVHFSWLSS
jgi:hypothetical protein